MKQIEFQLQDSVVSNYYLTLIKFIMAIWLKDRGLGYRFLIQLLPSIPPNPKPIFYYIQSNFFLFVFLKPGLTVWPRLASCSLLTLGFKFTTAFLPQPPRVLSKAHTTTPKKSCLKFTRIIISVSKLFISTYSSLYNIF